MSGSVVGIAVANQQEKLDEQKYQIFGQNSCYLLFCSLPLLYKLATKYFDYCKKKTPSSTSVDPENSADKITQLSDLNFTPSQLLPQILINATASLTSTGISAGIRSAENNQNDNLNFIFISLSAFTINSIASFLINLNHQKEIANLNSAIQAKSTALDEKIKQDQQAQDSTNSNIEDQTEIIPMSNDHIAQHGNESNQQDSVVSLSMITLAASQHPAETLRKVPVSSHITTETTLKPPIVPDCSAFSVPSQPTTLVTTSAPLLSTQNQCAVELSTRPQTILNETLVIGQGRPHVNDSSDSNDEPSLPHTGLSSSTTPPATSKVSPRMQTFETSAAVLGVGSGAYWG